MARLTEASGLVVVAQRPLAGPWWCGWMSQVVVGVRDPAAAAR